MLKVIQPSSDAFQNLKCGEVFCISPALYNVICCLCANNIHLDQFPNHFQMQHLALAEESINLKELEVKQIEDETVKCTVEDNILIKEEDIEDDPIKQDLEDEDDKSLLQLIKDNKENAKRKFKGGQTNIRIESDSGELNIGLNFESQIEMKHTKKRSRRRRNTVLEVNKKPEKNKLHVLSDDKTTANDVDLDLENAELKTDYDNVDIDRDWSLGDNISDSDSNPDDNDDSNDELPFPCHTCKRSYSSKRSLQKHNYSVHNPNKIPKKPKEPKAAHKCDLCNEAFRSARDLRGHKWKHTGIFCDICGKPFTQTGNMMRHKIRHTGIKAHKCKECNKEFFTSKELKSHMICHTGLMPVICEICGKRCRDRGVLTAHMRRHTGERPAKCDVCGKSFFSYHDLNVHAVTHSSERPFKCDICGSTFQRKKALRVHKLIHSKDRKHMCKICGKGFSQSGGLNSHMRTHDAALDKVKCEKGQMLAADKLDSTHSGNNALSTSIIKPPNENQVNIPESNVGLYVD